MMVNAPDKIFKGHFLSRKLINKLDDLRAARNYAVFNTSTKTSPPDWVDMLEVGKKVIIGLNKAIKAESAVEEEGERET